MTTAQWIEVKVTRIADRWHARLWVDGAIVDHMACENKIDTGWICREMLRWHDKTGGESTFASRARDRQTPGPTGKVWYQGELP